MPIELPFELSFPPANKEGITFCGISIPRYGSLTPNEAIALSELAYDENKPILQYYAEVVALILRSRAPYLKKQNTAEELMNLPIPRAALEAVFNFVISENRQWKEEPEEEPTDEVGEPPIGALSTGDSAMATLPSSALSENILAIAQS